MNANSGFPQFSLRGLLLCFAWSALVAAIATRWGGAGLALAVVLTAVSVACHLKKTPRAGRVMTLCPAVLLTAGWLVLRPRVARTPDLRSVCVNNERQVAMALERHASKHQFFPPAYTVNEPGAALHSWRTVLLPYFDRTDVHLQIHWDVPWSDPQNAEFRRLDLDVLRCPADPNLPTGGASYVAIVGPGFVFQGPHPVAPSEITDAKGQTLLRVGAMSTGIAWMEPRDLRWEEIGAKQQPLAGSSNHSRGVVATFAAGNVMMLPATISASHLHALLTIAGGEEMSWMDQDMSTW